MMVGAEDGVMAGILTRADHKVGMGHLTRSLVIAQGLRSRGFEVHFLTDSDIVDNTVEQEDYSVGLLPPMETTCAELKEALEAAIDRYGITLLLVDCNESVLGKLRFLDELDSLFIALLLSPVGYNFNGLGHLIFTIGVNLESADKRELVPLGDRLVPNYSGRNYIIFRREFQRDILRTFTAEGHRILISMGGGDPYRLTQKSIAALERIDRPITCHITQGAAMEHIREIRTLIAESRHDYYVHENINNISYLMQNTDIAFINGGNTRYELCVTGTPFIALSMTAYQYKCTKQISDLGAGVNLGIGRELRPNEIADATEELMDDVARREAMSEYMMTLFDTRGGDRIIERMLELYRSSHDRTN